ncbi:hypothetical protein LCGC14_2897640 [marine sediment metagenome]|uniref:Uncharacterized protein n=1 Tax=marine sediment metagenome TaxID=412755 RepID=A0A0F9A393_9ZZZZ
MDTSSEYIKMCDCPEIQGLSPLNYKNYVPIGSCLVHTSEEWGDLHHNTHNTTYGDFVYYELKDQPNIDFKTTWLPRQDQLQAMVAKPMLDLWDDFVEFVTIGRRREMSVGLLATYEQLWLRYVMKTKWEKVRDDIQEAWVAA